MGCDSQEARVLHDPWKQRCKPCVRVCVGWSVLLRMHSVGREKGLQSMMKCSFFSSTFIPLMEYKNDLCLNSGLYC